MKSISSPLGELISLTESKNQNKDITRLLGINISKNFMPSVANVSATDLSKYKIIRKNQFACNIMHVGRDERLPIALYKEEKPSIVSPAYKTFEIKNKDKVLPEYLMIYFQRSEFDRYTWYLCDSSIRGGLEWERLCEINIPIPSILEQKKYVSVYKNLIAIHESYKKSLVDLNIICTTFLEDKIKNEKKFQLGNYIELVNETNEIENIKNVKGISSVLKKFIITKANMKEVDISNYKIVRSGNFSFNPNTARMGDKIPIALNSGKDCVVSKIYPVFKIKNTNFLLPEYLNLWFQRSEFDRYARFHSWGSARETFNWSDMCNVELPIPSIDEQKSIVSIYRVKEKRKNLDILLKDKLRPLCPVLIKGVLENNKKIKIQNL